jgi:hypothetical protein
MAVQSQTWFKIGFMEAFPHGAYVKEVTGARDYEKSSRDNFVQATDDESRMLLWDVTVIDGDPKVKNGVTVKIAAPHQPVPAAPAPGSPFAAVQFEGLQVKPWPEVFQPKQGRPATGRVNFSYRAAGFANGAAHPVKASKAGDQ